MVAAVDSDDNSLPAKDNDTHREKLERQNTPPQPLLKCCVDMHHHPRYHDTEDGSHQQQRHNPRSLWGKGPVKRRQQGRRRQLGRRWQISRSSRRNENQFAAKSASVIERQPSLTSHEGIFCDKHFITSSLTLTDVIFL
ncbi:hypothetical protein PROFUN_16874 [Planoprotostelium fungivorum]|uniref:Uncharacterized protein n=1 Tax=Planoprotostelium fungivorum TaxID=1890364 RepID=A0A2P6MMR5_9EUKA|nr:hypothetical protein PROFUN_16874 [Planoprotostelium fungivorum]